MIFPITGSSFAVPLAALMIPITVSTANAMLTKLHTPPIIRETVSLTAPTALTIILLTNVYANWAIARTSP